jgi:ParB family chromosome partitioning protein
MMDPIPLTDLTAAAQARAWLIRSNGGQPHARRRGRGYQIKDRAEAGEMWQPVVFPPSDPQSSPDLEADPPSAPGFTLVPLSLLDPNPYQPRLHLNENETIALAHSLRLKRETLPATWGLLQVPLGRRTARGRVQLAFGHRRLAAFQHNQASPHAGEADWTKMPVQLVELSDTEMYQYAASENAERVALNPLEIAHSIKQAGAELNLTQAEAGRLHGYSKTAACNLLRLLQLPEAVQELIASGDLSQRHGRELLRLLQTVPPLRQQCLRQAEYAAAQEMSVTALKEVVDRHLERQVRDQARLAHRETRSCRRCGTEREFTGRELANEWGDFTCEGCFYTACIVRSVRHRC